MGRIAAATKPYAAVAATLALAFSVAAWLYRGPPDIAALPVVATVRDGSAQLRPLWTIRVAAAAHEIVVDAIDPPPLPEGHAFQLWLARADGPRSLGLLPASGRRVIPEIPARMAPLVGAGELWVSLEHTGGSSVAGPRGPVVYRAALRGGGGRD